MNARIQNYTGTGIRTSCSWIQIITDRFRTSKNSTTEDIFVEVDVAPFMRELGVPFYSYGNLPEIFDAPSNNLGNNQCLVWIVLSSITRFRMTSISGTKGGNELWGVQM